MIFPQYGSLPYLPSSTRPPYPVSEPSDVSGQLDEDTVQHFTARELLDLEVKVAELIEADPSVGKTPIVFLTAVVTREEAQSYGGVIGGRPFLAKPVSPDEVIKIIEEQLGDDPSVRNGSK